MQRRPRALLATLASGLAISLGLAACGDTTGPEALAAVDVARPAGVHGWVEDSTTTTLPPTTTTVRPTTTTTAAPPPTTPPDAVRSGSGSGGGGGGAGAAATPAPAPAPAPAPKPAASSCTEAGMLSMVNRARAQHGLGALKISGGATNVACGWSRHMARSGMAHNGNLSGDLAAQGVTGWKAIGENVGYGDSASEVFNLFMGSSGHRANILKSSYTHVGIGTVQANGLVWVTLDFVGF